MDPSIFVLTRDIFRRLIKSFSPRNFPSQLHQLQLILFVLSVDSQNSPRCPLILTSFRECTAMHSTRDKIKVAVDAYRAHIAKRNRRALEVYGAWPSRTVFLNSD